MLQTADIISENNQLTTLGEYYASYNTNNNLSNYKKKIDDTTIFPNPSKNIIYIDANSSRSFKARIFDLNGRILMKKIVKTQINISELKTGLYLIELSNEINKTTHKLIVNK